MRPPAIQAERCGPSTCPSARAACFNEAACNTGGTPSGGESGHHPVARFNEAACNTGGTLRTIRCAAGRGGGASMRPPAIQAERRIFPAPPLDSPAASMRPPAIQAERPAWFTPYCRSLRSFNEAACNTGGTLGRLALAGVVDRASMRPPAIQAERRPVRGRPPGPPSPLQ